MNKLQNKQLKKAYKKKLYNLNKAFFNSEAKAEDLLIEYLKFIRDSLILTTEEDLTDVNEASTKIATLIAAIAEFEACQNTTQKTFHLNSFFELSKQNMKDWLDMYDSI